MTSLDLVIGYHKLDTELVSGHFRHTTFHSDASQGRRRVAVVKKGLGRGSFGTLVVSRKFRNSEYDVLGGPEYSISVYFQSSFVCIYIRHLLKIPGFLSSRHAPSNIGMFNILVVIAKLDSNIIPLIDYVIASYLNNRDTEVRLSTKGHWRVSKGTA